MSNWLPNSDLFQTADFPVESIIYKFQWHACYCYIPSLSGLPIKCYHTRLTNCNGMWSFWQDLILMYFQYVISWSHCDHVKVICLYVMLNHITVQHCPFIIDKCLIVIIIITLWQMWTCLGMPINILLPGAITVTAAQGHIQKVNVSLLSTLSPCFNRFFSFCFQVQYITHYKSDYCQGRIVGIP
jgi:hypothetical protein